MKRMHKHLHLASESIRVISDLEHVGGGLPTSVGTCGSFGQSTCVDPPKLARVTAVILGCVGALLLAACGVEQPGTAITEQNQICLTCGGGDGDGNATSPEQIGTHAVADYETAHPGYTNTDEVSCTNSWTQRHVECHVHVTIPFSSVTLIECDADYEWEYDENGHEVITGVRSLICTAR